MSTTIQSFADLGINTRASVVAEEDVSVQSCTIDTKKRRIPMKRRRKIHEE